MAGSIMVPISSARGGAESATVAAAAIAACSVATILGFFFFQFGLGYPPCPLCLIQRIPFYVTLPLAVAVGLAAWGGLPRGLLAAGLAAIAAAMAISVGLGVYHSGVEWAWWAGPADCSGPLTNFGSAGSLLQTIETTRVVRCDVAAWRLFGLSLAGYNVLISAALAVIAFRGMAAAWSDRKGA